MIGSDKTASRNETAIIGTLIVAVKVPWWVWACVALLLLGAATDKFASAGWNAGLLPASGANAGYDGAPA